MQSLNSRPNSTTIDPQDLKFVPLDLDRHIELIQPWFQLPYANYWGMQGMSVEETRATYKAHIESGHFRVFIGFYKDQPSLVLETYDPNLDEIKDLYSVMPGDIGMHFFVAPTTQPIHGYTLAWMQQAMHWIFEELGASRVVVEPSIHNEKIHRLNLDVGFTYANGIQMASKVAMLAFCSPRDFYHSLKETPNLPPKNDRFHSHPRYENALKMINGLKETIAMSHPQSRNMDLSLDDEARNVAEHLTPSIWQKVNRHLVCKAISEFSHEQLFVPTLIKGSNSDNWATYQLTSDLGQRHYVFKAKKMALRHWRIDPQSITCLEKDSHTDVDALRFIIDFKATLAIPEDKLPIYLDEISSTLYGAAYKESNSHFDSRSLANANYQTIEAAMTEGHPCFVANNGRLGFDAFDYRQYAPETGQAFNITWIAVNKRKAVYGCIPGLDYEDLIKQELSSAKLEQFESILTNRGLSTEDYILMPVHPWQWFNKINIVFAAEIAKQDIVPLGESDDLYKAQQSIRTYFNVTDSHKHYVKTSLSILNMGFMRGLSPYYMEGTPKINAYLNEIISQDPILKQFGFSILQEVAAVGYRNPYFEAACEKDNPCKKMLSALWRESPIKQLKDGESLMSMTALLHKDTDNQSLLVELIKRSGLTPTAWLSQYLKAFFQPLLHCFYAYDLTFMPHGENLILVLKDHVPSRAIMKDIAEESAILNTEVSLPADIARLAVEVPEEYKILGIFIDVFDGYFRHMSHILEESGTLTGDDFWGLVADSAIAYQAQHPELQDKFESRNLFAPDFLHSCLNRLQLKNNLQMVDLADPASSLIMAEPLPNPIAPFAPGANRKAQSCTVTEQALA